MPTRRPIRPVTHITMNNARQIDEQKLTGTDRPCHLILDVPNEFPVPQFGEHDLGRRRTLKFGSRRIQGEPNKPDE